ncbi:MAG TPA: hypothetical protein DEA46_06225 [Candidatus Moranbacteria bacterium]|nr:hypothetical protein [Candidatus Moranbacteria bacterium]
MNIMEKVYKEIIDYILESGKRIVKKSGNIKDIGVAKKDLTEEDLRIERDLENIIKKHNPNHELFAEEEHDSSPNAEDIWVADPISGTSLFIHGEPHYALVIAHMKNNVVQFAVAYDPSADELFTAYKGKGAFLNGKPIEVSKRYDVNKIKVIFAPSSGWKDEGKVKEITEALIKYSAYKIRCSFALRYCYVACGRYDGIIALTKDVFPEVAGGFIIREAGGIFKNDKGENILKYNDRIFVGGNKKTYEILKSVIV